MKPSRSAIAIACGIILAAAVSLPVVISLGSSPPPKTPASRSVVDADFSEIARRVDPGPDFEAHYALAPSSGPYRTLLVLRSQGVTTAAVSSVPLATVFPGKTTGSFASLTLAPDRETTCSGSRGPVACAEESRDLPFAQDSPQALLAQSIAATVDSYWNPSSLTASLRHFQGLSPAAFPLAVKKFTRTLAGIRSTCLAVRSQQIYPTPTWTLCVLPGGGPASYEMPSGTATLETVIGHPESGLPPASGSPGPTA